MLAEWEIGGRGYYQLGVCYQIHVNFSGKMRAVGVAQRAQIFAFLGIKNLVYTLTYISIHTSANLVASRSVLSSLEGNVLA